MQCGNSISDNACMRCMKKLGTRNITYRDELWWHLAYAR
jgi:hypothetical protein